VVVDFSIITVYDTTIHTTGLITHSLLFLLLFLNLRPIFMDRDKLQYYPLTDMQRGMLFYSLFGKQPGVYVIQARAALNERVNLNLLQQAWDWVIARYELLRARLDDAGDTEMALVIERQAQCQINFIDFSDHPESEKKSLLNDFLAKDKAKSFDFYQAPLMRLTLVKLDQDQYHLIWTHHHIISSGQSAIKIMLEVFPFYDVLCKSEQMQLPQVDSYQKFIDYSQQLDISAAKDYWQKLLSGFSTPTQLSISTNHDASLQIRSTETVAMSVEQSAQLKKFARKYHLTPNIIIQGAWGLLLSKYSLNADVVFGAVRALSPRVTKNLIGLFINTLPIRAKMNVDDSVVDYLLTIRAQHAELKRFAITPLRDIQQWSEIRRGVDLFNTFVDFQPESPNAYAKKHGGACWQHRSVGFTSDTHYPLALTVCGEQGEFHFKLNYGAGIYDADIAHQLSQHLLNIIKNFIEFPENKIAEIECVSAKEREIVLKDWNKTSIDYPKDKNLAQLFEDQAQKTPDHIALTFGDEKLTYQQLNNRANQLAHHLKKQGIVTEDLVPICFERGLDMIVAILAILKAGAAYVPLDVSFPKARINYILTDVNAKIVLTQKILTDKINQSIQGGDTSIIVVDELTQSLTKENIMNLPVQASPHNLAYTMYTSGSTGNPKGVLVEHGSVVNCVLATRDNAKANSRDKFLAVTSLTFDVSVIDYFVPFVLGIEVVIASQEERTSGAQLLCLLQRHQITAMQGTSGTWNLLLNAQWKGEENFKIFTIGEPLTDALAKKLQKCGQVYDFYGPTEAAIYASFKHVQPGQAVTIGKPMGNIKTYVLDQNLQPVPIRVAGELYIGGIAVARGYLNLPELTQERFINDPFSDDKEARLYKTGDLVRLLPNGEIEFLGRMDTQVKIRGYRMELGEIENNLLNYPAVDRCAVIVREDGVGVKILVAYLTVKENQTIDVISVRQFLAQTLPEYMIPTTFHVIPELPLTPSGKIDRNNLPSVEAHLAVHGAQASNDVEKKIVDVLRKLIKRENIDVEHNFFEIGVHSLMILQLCDLLNRQFKVNLQPVDLFTYHSVRLLAGYIDRQDKVKPNILAIKERIIKKHQQLRKKRKRMNEQANCNKYTE